MLENVKRDKLTLITLIAFGVFAAWWVFLQATGEKSGNANYLFGAIYGPVMTLFGGIVGVWSAKQWGGWKSIMGRAILALSLGLLAQFFGQIANSAYNVVLKVEAIYPGIPDIGFFSSVCFYLYGIILLAQASGIKFRLRSFSSQLQAIVIPTAMLAFSYVLFLKHYEFDWSNPLTIFLDFAYPLGQALNVSLAIVTYSLSRKVLGGVMRPRVFLLIAAFIAQYIADFSFLYLISKDAYFVGGIVDFFYLLAYTVMCLGLLQLRTVAMRIQTNKSAEKNSP